MRSRRIIQFIAWVAAAVFLIALALRDVQLDQQLELNAKMDRATPYLSTFGPPTRVVQEKRPQRSFSVRVTGEPVYVNLRIPRWFRRATVELEYENPNALPLRVGVRTHPTQWAFHFPGVTDCSTPGVEQTCVRVPFDLQRAWQVERNVYRFVLSVPGVSSERPIVIRGFRVIAEREPVCIGRLCI